MTAEPAAPPVRARRGARVVVAVLFLLAFGWRIFGAASDLAAWVGLAVASGGQLTSTAWVVLILGIAIPVIGYVAALVVGRRRPLGSFALILLLALCVSEALSLGQLAFFLSVTGTL
jgi:uncharacterized membrane protein